MEYLHQSFSVTFEYRVHFTSALFHLSNTLFSDFIEQQKGAGTNCKILFVADQHVLAHHPFLADQIKAYFDKYRSAELISEVIIIPGGEIAKNDRAHFNSIVNAVNAYGIDRHSYLAGIGGGSVLDVCGFAAAVSHRGIKHIRIPTTVLSQNDSGVGVKNGINYKSKKNFLGTFAPPVAVFNDDRFLTTLSDRDWLSGISEAVKVALIKDASFFIWLEEQAAALVARDMDAMHYLIKRCAELHMQHISSGDPFEAGSSRPLDYGHWSAHKLEQLTDFELTHGEAVAIGIALDAAYSCISGLLDEAEYTRIIQLLTNLRFSITHPLLDVERENSQIFLGLEEFQQHLGGRLTIMLLAGIGKGKEVHTIDREMLRQAGMRLVNGHW
ncbi:MAG: 3-dehydroquinate synthase [Chitinophagaceae bacterium]